MASSVQEWVVTEVSNFEAFRMSFLSSEGREGRGGSQAEGYRLRRPRGATTRRRRALTCMHPISETFPSILLPVPSLTTITSLLPSTTSSLTSHQTALPRHPLLPRRRPALRRPQQHASLPRHQQPQPPPDRPLARARVTAHRPHRPARRRHGRYRGR